MALLLFASIPAPLWAQAGEKSRLVDLFESKRELLKYLKRVPPADYLAIFPFDDGFGAIFMGNVHLETDEFSLWADNVGIRIFEPPEGMADDATSDEQVGNFKVFADGLVTLVRDETSIRGESLLYDSATRKAIVTNARFRTNAQQIYGEANRYELGYWNRLDPQGEAGDLVSRDPSAPQAPSNRSLEQLRFQRGARLVVAAERLELTDFERIRAAGLEITNCDFEHPHWAIRAERARVYPVERAEEEKSSVRIEIDDGSFRFWDVPPIPIGNLTFDTYWAQTTPLRSLSYSNSSKFGNRIQAVWNGNLLFPKRYRGSFDLGIRTEYLSARGVGYGLDWEYGVRTHKWSRKAQPGKIDVYGIGLFYAIEDRGEDRFDMVPARTHRNRVRSHTRIRFPTQTLVDVEYSAERDSNFLEEYYQNELRSEKRPESIVYLRQPFSDDFAATVLVRRQTVPYRAEVEKLPEVSLQLIQYPFRHFSVDVVGRAADLRFLPDNETSLNSRRMGRADLKTRIASAFGSTKYGKIRPFFEARGTLYEEDIDGNSKVERYALAAGAQVGWHIGRTFKMRLPFFDTDLLRHTIDPSISFFSLYDTNVDPSELFRFDSTEDVDTVESLRLSLRQYLRARRSDQKPERNRLQPATEIAEIDFEIDYFPEASRDNAGDNWGTLNSEFLFRVHPRVSVFCESRLNVEDRGRFEEFQVGLNYRESRFSDYLNQDFGFGVSHRTIRGRTENLTANFYLKTSDRYEVAMVWEQDLRDHETLNQEYALIRNFHDWSLVFTFEVDQGEDDNVSFGVNFLNRGIPPSGKEFVRSRLAF